MPECRSPVHTASKACIACMHSGPGGFLNTTGLVMGHVARMHIVEPISSSTGKTMYRKCYK